MNTTSLTVLSTALLVSAGAIQAEVIFEDNFNRASLGSGWATSGAGTNAFINGSEQLELEGAGPVYYSTSVATGASNTTYTIEYDLISLSDQTAGNYIGIVSLGDNLAGDRVQANYVTNGSSVHSLFIQAYDDGTRVENYYTDAGVNLRQYTSRIVYELVTDGSGDSTVAFSAYEDATKTNLLFQAGPQALTTSVGSGFIGINLPSDAYEGYAIDNFSISEVVPEPSSAVLLAAGGLALLSPFRRQKAECA